MQYIVVKELKSVPIEIIKRFKVVPDKVLQYIGKKSDSILVDFPLSIKRRVWEANTALFVSYVSAKYFTGESSLSSYTLDIYDPKKSHAIDALVGELMVDVGPSEKLFNAAAGFLVKKAFEATAAPSSAASKSVNIYSHLLRMLVIAASVDSNKIVTLLKVYEFSRLIDAICSAGSVSDAQLVALAEHLRASILVQVGHALRRSHGGAAARREARFVRDPQAIAPNAFLEVCPTRSSPLLLDRSIDRSAVILLLCSVLRSCWTSAWMC